jgi:hypothetical protein
VPLSHPLSQDWERGPGGEGRPLPPDAILRTLTLALVQQLAPRLGLRADALRIELGPEAERRTAARGARGLTANDTVFLGPRHFHPAQPSGRYLLGHELAHVAQARLAPAAVESPPEQIEAELEADVIGRAAARGGVVSAPRVPLVAEEAADTDVETKRGLLRGAVLRGRTPEIRRIKKYLGGLWISDGDVSRVMRILQSVALPVATAMITWLEKDERKDLANNIDSVHYKPFRREILAFAAALEDDLLDRYAVKLLSNIGLYELDTEEYLAATQVLHRLKPDKTAALEKTSNARAVRTILASPVDEAALVTALEESARAEQQEVEARQTAAALFTGNTKVAGELWSMLREIVDLLDRWIVRDRHVLGVLEKLGRYLREPQKLRAIADALEERGLLDKLIDELPLKVLFTDNPAVGRGRRGEPTPGEEMPAPRKVFLMLVSFRPAYKNVELAEKLLSYGLFDWVITDEEAMLAFHLVKALPERARQSFLAFEGEKYWKRIDDNITQSMREGAAMNFYTGGTEGADRNSILSQLVDDDVWSEAQIGRLQALIRMAYAADERYWVFRQSKDQVERRKIHESARIRAEILDKYELYNPLAVDDKGQPRPRVVWKPETLKGTGFFGEGFWTYLAWLGQLVDLIFSSDNIRILGQPKGAEGLSLAEAQDLFGGSVYGAKFARPTFTKKPPQGQAETRINFADVLINTDTGLITATAPHVRIENINLFVGDLKVQTGAAAIETLTFRLGYPKEERNEPPFLELGGGSVTVADITLIWPESMVTINRLSVSGLNLEMGAAGLRAELEKTGANIPPYVSGAFLGPISVLEPTVPMEFNIALDGLEVNGLATSSGRYIESVGIAKLNLRGGGTPDAYERALAASVQRLQAEIAAPRPADDESLPRLRAQLAATQAELERVRATAAEIKRLQDQQRGGGGLSREEAERLRALQATLKGGAVLDAGRITVKGIGGDLKVGDVELKAVHGMGGTPTALIGLATDSETLMRMIRGERPPPVRKGAENDPATFAIDIGHIELGRTGGEPAIEQRESIPTIKDLDDRLAALEEELVAHPGDLERYDEYRRLEKLRPAVARYHELLRMGVANLTPKEMRELRELRAALRAEMRVTFSLGRLRLEGTTIEVGEAGRRFTLRAAELEAEEVVKGGLRIGRITGSDVRADVTAGSDTTRGIAALLDLRAHLQKGEVGAASLTIEDVSREGMGRLVEKVSVTEGTAGVDVGTGSATATAKAKSIVVQGLGLLVSKKLLEAERDRLLARMGPAEPIPAGPREAARLKEIDARLADLEGRLAALAEAEAVYKKADEAVSTARGKKEKEKRESERAEAAALLERRRRYVDDWHTTLIAEQLAITDLNVVASGLGDVRKPDWDPAKAVAAGGITIRGGGPGQQIAGEVTVTRARAGGIGVEELRTGPIRGAATVKGSSIEVESFGIDSVSVTGFAMLGASSEISAPGTITASGIAVSGTLSFEQDAKTKDWSLRTIVVKRLDIASIEGLGLTYVDYAKDRRVEVSRGALGGIWADNIVVDMPRGGEMSVTGVAGLQSVTDLRLKAVLGRNTFRGTVNARGLKATFADKEQSLRIDNVTLTDAAVITPDGNVRISRLTLAGDITRRGNAIFFKNIRIGELRLAGFDLRAGTASIKSTEPTVLLGARVDAMLTLDDKGNVQAVEVTDLNIDLIDCDDLTYKDGDLSVHITRRAGEPGAALQIVDLYVTGLHWSAKAGITGGKVDVSRISSDLKVEYGTSLKADASVQADKLHLQFRKGGEIVTRIEDLSVEAGVEVSGLKTKVRLEHADTGDVFITDEMIRIPDLRLPLIAMTSLAYDSPSLKVTVKERADAVVLEGTRVNLSIERTPTAKTTAGKGGAATPAIKQIAIHQLDVPTIKASGISILLKDKDVEITLPETERATLSNLHLEPEQDLIVKPPEKEGESWTIAGTVTLDKFDLPKLGLRVGSSVSARADVTGKTLSFTGVDDGTWTLTLAQLRAENIEGEVKGSKFSVLSGASRHKGVTPGVEMNRFSLSSTGAISIGDLGVSGFVFTTKDGNIHVDIASARLPQKIDIPPGFAGTITVPELLIEKAFFNVKDFDALGGGTKSPKKKGGKEFDWTILDKLDGTLNMDLKLPIRVYTLPSINREVLVRQQVWPIRMKITKGVVDYTELEDEATWARFDALVDFEWEDPELVLEIDYVFGRSKVKTWTMSGADIELAKQGKIRLSRLINPDKTEEEKQKEKQRKEAEERGEELPPEPEGEAKLLTDQMEFRNVNADLSLLGSHTIEIDDEGSQIVLGAGGKDAVSHFKATSKSAREIALSLERATAQIPKLKLGDATLSTGVITIEDVRDTVLKLAGWKPKSIEGTIGKASAQSIQVTLPETVEEVKPKGP